MGDKNKIVLAVVTTAAITAIISSTATSYVKDTFGALLPTDDEDKAFSNKMKVVEMLLDNKYLYDYDKDKLRENAVKAYVDGLDEPYTHYYPAEEFTSYIDNIQDGYIGIGVIVGVNDDNQIEVIAPFEGSPAFEAGIEPEDIITAVDGTAYSGDMLTEAVNSIKSGKEGTDVLITVLRNGEEKSFTVTRGDISSESVSAKMLDENIGYMRISAFNMESKNGEHSTATEFKEELSKLQADGAKSLILDLRDNPGGVLDVACDIADELLPEGAITYTEDKDGERKYFNSDEQHIDIPIAVLINGNSASASEVLTGALKDYGRAVVIGEKSYGKGIVQDVYPFYDGSGISFTSAKYYTPNGICIHDIGIEPDVAVEMDDQFKDMYASMIAQENDAQLKKAIEIIKEK